MNHRIAAILLFVFTVGFAGIADLWLSLELDEARRIRVTIDAENALQTESTLDGELTIVRETKSAKYHFLNKRSYTVHTSSVSRQGTVLRGQNTQDKARADRHSDARRTKRPVVEKHASGHYRVTIADGLRSAEVFADPDLTPPPFPWISFVGLGLILCVFGVVLQRKKNVRYGWLGLTGIAGLLAAFLIYRYQIECLAAAQTFLNADGRRAPRLAFPLVGLWAYLAAAFTCAMVAIGFISSSYFARATDELRSEKEAYIAISPAMLGLSLLVGIPFLVGVILAFFRHVHGDFTFVGFENFSEIMSGSEGPHSIFYTLIVTVIWTFLNVVFHLGIGLMLALLLHRHASGWTRIYRVILIVPWAVPAYLTALIWRSMFDADVGVINRILGLEDMSWMHDTVTAFIANLVTNVWLGFPFMMVVCLGALTSIPKDLYDAADVDGANAWQKFTQITLPLLRPALLPAVILGSIWTFNKFEVIYLVSEGRPDGGTDILVTEAYRWAFERGLAQGGAYGKAAACSVLIFLVLLIYGWMTARVSRSAEEALR